MPDINIVKLIIRRGTNTQRKSVVLEQGELGFTIDETRRVYVGDGSTLGGKPIGSVFHLPVAAVNGRTSLYAEVGDVVYDTSLLYQLTSADTTELSAWKSIGTVFDNSTLEYDALNIARIKDNGITGTKFAQSAAYNQGGLIATVSNGLSANVDNTTITINSNKLSVNTIDENNIASSSFGDGIIGGSGNLISVNADSGVFGFSSGVMLLTALPSEVVTVDSLSSNFVGAGLYVDNDQIKANIQTVNTQNLAIVNNQLGFTSLVSGRESIFESITYNDFGQVVDADSLIVDTLSGGSIAFPYFNGELDQTTFTDQTIYTVVSTDDTSTVTQQLTSAGFMIVKIGPSEEVAIPIFKL
jgi:hypothetical protein